MTTAAVLTFAGTSAAFAQDEPSTPAERRVRRRSTRPRAAGPASPVWTAGAPATPQVVLAKTGAGVAGLGVVAALPVAFGFGARIASRRKTV